MKTSFEGKRILTLLAHPDDETLGCGGTIARAVSEGAEVHCWIPVKRIVEQCSEALSGLGVTNIHFGKFEDNLMDTYPLINIAKWFEKAVSEVKPDIVFLHHRNCLNQDHRACFEAGIIATRFSPVSILSCEIPSSTGYLRPCGFEPNFYVKLEAEHVKSKIEALQCYSTELEKPPHPFSLAYIDSLMTVRGGEVNSAWAEGFMLVRGYA